MLWMRYSGIWTIKNRNGTGASFCKHYISRLYETKLEKKSDVMSVRAKLLVLSEDESVRDGLDPAFAEFIMKPSLHPATAIQNCILSLL